MKLPMFSTSSAVIQQAVIVTLRRIISTSALWQVTTIQVQKPKYISVKSKHVATLPTHTQHPLPKM